MLQQLILREGSSRQEAQPRRRTDIRRSFSDQFAYSLKKRLVDRYSEHRLSVSPPSHLSPIGRLLRTYAGQLHIVQLHKPANGCYGIYIKQGREQKIFVSRFASVDAEKFYAGLLTPGDEIVTINGQEIKGRSLDSVHSDLAQLDSPILAILPVTSYTNYW